MWPGETGNNGTQGSLRPGECRKNSTLGNCSGEFIAVGVAPGKKDIIGDRKGHLIGVLFLFKIGSNDRTRMIRIKPISMVINRLALRICSYRYQKIFIYELSFE
jgi:hypothetical protein